MTRRRAATILLGLAACAAVGALATTGIAWACALWSGERLVVSRSMSSVDTPRIHVAAGHYLRPELLQPSSHLSMGRWFEEQRRSGVGLSIETVLIGEGRFNEFPGGPEHGIMVFRCGWPMRALDCGVEWEIASAISPKWRCALVPPEGARPLPIGGSGALVQSRRLPIAVIAPGFAIDTLVFTSLVAATVFVPSRLRAQSREARGQCRRCGYDLRGSTASICPECGT